MQEAFVGHRAQESHLSAGLLASLHKLNHRFLDLSATGVNARPTAQLGRLSAMERAAAAHCPYALFDLRFGDEGHWQVRLQNAGHWRVADESPVDEPNDSGDPTAAFVRLALFFSWHLASTTGLGTQLVLGMSAATAAAFRRIAVDDLPALVVTETSNLRARFSDCSAYWNALTCAATRTDKAVLRRVQLYGLQLAAAARLPRLPERMRTDLR